MERALRQISATALAPAAHWNLGWFQRLTLGVAILDTSIQVDAYLFYQDKFADVGAIGGLNVSISTICLGVLYALWLIDAAIASRHGERSRTYVNVPLTLYILVSTLSWVVAQEKLLALNSIVLLGQTYLLYEYVANKVTTRDDVVYVVSIFAAALAIQGVAMIGLRALGHGVEWGPVAGIIGADGRVGGTIGSPVTGGSFLALMIAPSMALLVMPVARRLKLLATAALGLGGIGLLLTQTRGSWIAVVFSVSVFFALAWYRGWISLRLPIFACVIAVLFAAIFHDGITNRVLGDDEGSAAGRLPLFQMAWEMICDHPFTGVGANNCAAAAEIYSTRPEMRGEWFWTIHNRYLLEWVETGIVGLALYVVFLLATLRTGWRAWRRNDRLLSPIALALVLALAGQMVHMFVDVFNSRPQVQTMWLCAAMVAAIGRIEGQEV